MKSSLVLRVVAPTVSLIGLVVANGLGAVIPTEVTIVGNGLIGQSVDWGQFGPAGTSIPQPFQAVASGGYKFTVLKNNSPTPYFRADQGNGFSGDFLPAERLLYSTSLTAFDLRFATPVEAVGGQLQRSTIGDWTPFARVFTINGGVYDFIFPVDNNAQSADGSAPFIGVGAASPIITRVLFDSYTGGNTALGPLTIDVPEPCSLAIAAVAGFSILRRRDAHRVACRAATSIALA